MANDLANMRRIQRRQKVWLLVFSMLSFALSYATAIVLARGLGADGYDNYAVAVSFAAILATLAEMGTGKYALRIMPAYSERHDWSAARGYLRFSMRWTLIASLSLAIIGAVWEYSRDGVFGNYALGVVLLFLPAMAWVGAGSEFVTANQAAIRSGFVTRLLVPGVTLLLALLWIESRFTLTATSGGICYGLGWLAGVIAVYCLVLRTTRKEILNATPVFKNSEWLKSIWPFLYFALLISVLAKIGVIILEVVAQNEAIVSIYSVAAETGMFIGIVAKSTDKLYLSNVSTLLERRDLDGLKHLARVRWLWIGSITLLFLSATFFFGKQILAMFGEEFVEGYAALCVVAVSSSVWTMNSLTPAFLKYLHRQKLVVITTTLTVLIHVLFCVPLGYWFGATGAAVSYAIPVIGMYLMMAVLARQELTRISAD
ncbi:MAG: oligosaccharide flippase family protein [Pirellulaceae bacterium]|nr:oligosaccharide flippase family protein [Pirellulaceae bacterium]